MELICRICGNKENNKSYIIDENMFGFQDSFIYFICNECNCLQIRDYPKQIKKYYPKNYYSYLSNHSEISNNLRDIFRFLIYKYIIFNSNLNNIENFIHFLYSRFLGDSIINPLMEIKLKKDFKILDIGSGSGRYLNFLKKIGFKNILGIDPFIKKDIIFDNGLRIEKKSIFQLKSNWNIIMLHHSLEHMKNQKSIFHQISKLLARNGTIIIRTPTTSSFAWKNYRENWVQIDAPSHFYIHSIKSLKILSHKSNLEIKKIIYDSTAFQFCGSEQYKKNIPLNSRNSYFDRKSIKNYRNKAKLLNEIKLGDQIIVLLNKSGD